MVHAIASDSKSRAAWRALSALVADDNGEDLIEYALLTTFVAFAGAAAVGLILTAIHSTYTSWDSETNGVNSLWQSPPP